MSEPMRVGDILCQIVTLSIRDQIRQVLSEAGWSDPSTRMIIPERGDPSPAERYFDAVAGRPHAPDPQRYAEYVEFWRSLCHAFLLQHGPGDYAPGWTLAKVMEKLQDAATLRGVADGIAAQAEQPSLFPNSVPTHP